MAQEILAPRRPGQHDKQWKPGQSGNPAGKPAGTPNKLNAQVKDMILEALEGVGGANYLMACALMPSTAAAFLTLIGRVLPIQVASAPPEGMEITVLERRVVSAKKIGA